MYSSKEEYPAQVRAAKAVLDTLPDVRTLHGREALRERRSTLRAFHLLAVDAWTSAILLRREGPAWVQREAHWKEIVSVAESYLYYGGADRVEYMVGLVDTAFGQVAGREQRRSAPLG